MKCYWLIIRKGPRLPQLAVIEGLLATFCFVERDLVGFCLMNCFVMLWFVSMVFADFRTTLTEHRLD